MKEINQMQQDLQTKKRALDNELYNSNSKMKEDILTRIQNFLKDYNKDCRYDYIFSCHIEFSKSPKSLLHLAADLEGPGFIQPNLQ